MSLFNELKRRNVFKVAIAYIIVAWLLLQVSDTLVPALHLPDWFLSGVAFLLILGFPVSIIFAWAFELTPEGLKREREIERAESITRATGRKLEFIIIGFLVLALAFFAYDKFVLSTERDSARVEATDEIARAQAEKAQFSDRSIAVLPFVNMSADKEQEYFADGLSEELLNLLAQTHGLDVTARTSSFAFKGQNRNISEIAEILKVKTVLEGSVRRADNRLRITAKLINASDGYNLWSQSYDREMTDVFELQEDIAQEIITALRGQLDTGEMPVRGRPTDQHGGIQSLSAGNGSRPS